MLMQLRIWRNCQYSPTIYWWVVCAKTHHANDCFQMSTLRCTTISNTVIIVCTLHNFVSSRKLDLLIQALLLDHILALKKTTRTPRVHLVSSFYRYGKTTLCRLSQCLSVRPSDRPSVLCRNTFGTRFWQICRADWF